MNAMKFNFAPKLFPTLAIMVALLGCLSWTCPAALADMDFDGDLSEEQAKEKQELQEMRDEMGDVKGTINDALGKLQTLSNQVKAQQNKKEIHLFAREADWETYPGSKVHCLTYNGKIPGPEIQVTEGEVVQIVLHNQLTVPTSLHFHGMQLPHNIDGLPRAGAGLIEPGGTYAYQFIAKQPGTFWYHPQVIHAQQKQMGMYGPLIVHSKAKHRPVEQDITMVLSELVKVPRSGAAGAAAGGGGDANFNAVALTNGPIPPANAKYDYLMNGKAAPAIPSLNFRKGDRVLLRVINASGTQVPLHLSGHRFVVLAREGSDRLEPQVFRDTITLNPSDRAELEILASNPGVWSLASELAHQVSRNGKFPGGMACVIKYSEAAASAPPEEAGGLPPEE
jgi:FtsP/CotA-like multicopper oxidase with cupredoxin domain